MNDEIHPESPQPIGGPEPIETHRGRKILKRMAITVVAGVGGLFVLATGLVPGRCAGATRSSKLRWQERQDEITRAVQAADLDQPAREEKGTVEQKSAEP